MGIRKRVILVIVTINFAIILFSVVSGISYDRAIIKKYMEADMLVVADIADQFISTELELLRSKADYIILCLSNADKAEWADVLAEENTQNTQFLGMAVYEHDSGIITATGEMPVQIDLLDEAIIERALNKKTSFTSTVSTDNGVVFYLAAPFPEEDSLILVLTIPGLYFCELTAAYHVWDTGYIFIDDNEGYIIANTRRYWVEERQNFINLAKTDAQYEELASMFLRMIKGERGIDYYYLTGSHRICAFRPITGADEGWSLGIVAPLAESPTSHVNRGFFLLGLIGLILSSIAAIIASSYIKKPYEEVAALKEAAEAHSQSKSNYLAVMSHEMRTPMNAVIGFSELLLAAKEGDNRCEVCTDELKKIHSASMSLLSIINDILDISKIESGKFEILPEDYDMASFINDTAILNSSRIGEKPIKFLIDIDESLPSRLWGDDLRIKQICNNLLSNAFKYTTAGTVTWKVDCQRDEEGDGVWMILSISDTGIGIRDEDVDKLFVDYSQVDSQSNRYIEGTGLGLPLSKKIAELMGGSITMESEYGKGSVFTAKLRQKHLTETPIGPIVAKSLRDFCYNDNKRSVGATLNRVQLPNARVLVVDDLRVNLEITKGMMKPYGMKVDGVISGADAVEAIRREDVRYCAIFMDHMMPGMDGVEATRIIREEIGTEYAKTVPIIALTANAVSGNEEIFLKKGFQAFVTKPIDIMRLDKVIRQWVKNEVP
ncbi:MAG: ATP-binding protein [Firmicutes bacterium]|nr:ATP-binding protein [Bacillota bacterium]